MSNIRFFKLISVPQNIRENSVYAIRINQNYYKLYVSDNTGNLLELNSENSNRLNGYLPSVNPNPNVLVLSDTTGKIDYGFLPNIYNNYGRLRVGTTLPTTDIKENDLFYNTSNNKLFIRKGSNWTEVDWQTIVRASPEWNSGLRINNNQLQISPDGTSWFNCIPAVGCNIIEILNVDNTNYSFLYWIPVGVGVIFKGINHLPIVYAKNVEPIFYGTLYNTTSYDGFIGLRPNNSSLSNGQGQLVGGNGTTAFASRITNSTIFPLIKNANTTENWGTFWFQIKSNQRFLGNSISHANGGYMVASSTTSATAPAQSYWLGTFFTHANASINIINLFLLRVA